MHLRKTTPTPRTIKGMTSRVGTCVAAVAMIASMAGCQPTAQLASAVYDSGTSLELAQLRKSEIKDLRYNLFFSLPEKKSQRVKGKATLRLRIDTQQELVLDFKTAAESIASVVVNGKDTKYTFSNEHIIIPVNATRKGENTIDVVFTANDQSLNRNDDFMYTLLVPDRARTLFPCFDQPNLKARFTLSLDVPADWQAVTNTSEESERVNGDRKSIAFGTTEPLSTYLFAFAAGKLERKEYHDGERRIAAYYRETDTAKVAQLDTIFKQVCASLRWQEEYTGIPYPFAKYDFVILPGFQFGGMEHTGATFYNDRSMFLSANPTPDEELARAQLIAHETSHMWFGDLVTMDWFDDVWTKEVFANYYAACITEPMFPDVNHQLNWLKTYTAAALSEDRTTGTTPIRQPLDNLRNAGLVYSQIVYDKAPVMMKKIVELMGEDKFREGIREYLNKYAYGNATWDDLIAILDSKTDHDLKAFSQVWVNAKGMPQIKFETAGTTLTVSQTDPYGRGLLWPQSFAVTVCGVDRDTVVTVDMADSLSTVSLPFSPQRVLPNTDGRGYGLFVPDAASLQWLLLHWHETPDATARQSLLMVLYEDYMARLVSDEAWISALLRGLRSEDNALIASAVVSRLPMPLRELTAERRDSVEKELYHLSYDHKLKSCRTQLMRTLASVACSPDVVNRLHLLWKDQSSDLLGERDYTNMAYELALRLPEQADTILTEQRSRITNPDRLRQFDYISRAVVADTVRLDSLFASLLKAENRRIEPWASAALGYLNHPVRGDYSVKYIRPALEALSDVQRTGDIFFPRNWVGALLSGHNERAAYDEVKTFLDAHPDYSPLLRSKILLAAYPLYRKYAGER